MLPRITFELAQAAGKDAANERMRKAGRTKWNRADYNHACRVTEKLWPSPQVSSVRFAPVSKEMEALGDRIFQRIVA